ncbi:hypothetical protein IT399_00355 [Candidatus Nomurabacteria bacterium]|nr:hypothetical protein [Candidatus Nomurabacteria bacterium]
MKENFNEKPQKIWTKEEAEMQIKLIFQGIMQEGSTDAEPSLFKEILKDLASGKLSPMEAVGKAMRIEESRQSYH